MEIRQLRYAQAVASYSSFSKAASSLFVTQQTLSQQIRRLEDELGFALFSRSTRSVALTEKGAALLRHAEEALSAFDALEREAAALRESPSAQLRLGVLPTFSHLNLLETIHGFQNENPALSVALQIRRSGSLLDLLLAGRLDAAVANLSEEQRRRLAPTHEMRIVARDTICALLRPEDVPPDTDTLSLRALADRNLLLLEKGSSVRARVEEALGREKIRPAGITDCPEIHSMLGMIRSGLGVGFLSFRVAEPYLSPDICRVGLSPEIESVTALIFPRDCPQRTALEALAGQI